MSGSMTAEAQRQNPRRDGFAETQLEQQGLTLETGAPVTGALAFNNGVAAGFVDGTLRFFQPEEQPTVVKAHSGAILDLAADSATGAVLTGGDDGRFVRVSPDGAIEVLPHLGQSGSIASLQHRVILPVLQGARLLFGAQAPQTPKPSNTQARLEALPLMQRQDSWL